MARRKKNSARVNLVLSAGLHALFVFVIFFFAAREGLVGSKLKEITVALVPKEKPPEPPKEKPPEPKIEPPKEEDPKPTPTPQVEPPPVAQTAPPPAQETAAAAAPAAAVPADFAFDDGAKVVETSTNAPVAFYRNFVEYTLRSRWNRPEDILDDSLVAEVELEVDGLGKVLHYAWKRTSGNKRWDDSITKVMDSTKTISRVPPKGFPPKFLVRFDIQPATETLVQ